MTTINEKLYREIRCPNCHKLHGYEYVYAGRLAFYCKRCDELIELEFKHIQTQENIGIIKDEFSVKNPENKKGGEN